jgi:hypothetical protein
MNWWQRFLCNVLGWHTVDRSQKCGFNMLGINATANCARCGKRVLQDSQGNWFEAG